MKEKFYLRDLKQIIDNDFPSLDAFCKATKLPPGKVKELLAGRGDFSAETMEKGLKRIGYRLHIAPARKAKRTG